MEAKTLNCPMCGAASATDASKCGHCGARLATIACPSCFGMIFRGAKFCSHCGEQVDRKETGPTTRCLCPKCRLDMKAVVVGQTPLRECSKCEGLWVDGKELQRIYEDREQQTAVLGMAMAIPDPGNLALEPVRYVPCPACQKLMNRVNFARCSAVVVDVCKTHGTWFDKDELRRVIEFIRAGGFEKARANEIAALERERAALKAAQVAGAYDHTSIYGARSFDVRETAVEAVAAAILEVIF